MYSAGTGKSLERRGDAINKSLFKGHGIDIGGGHDPLNKYGFDAYNWDLKDGDAELLSSAKDKQYDFVYSSHCLEHMKNPKKAIKNWVRVCKTNGNIVIVIPDEELYEHNMWPSRFNTDHKWSFRICSGHKLHNNSLSVFEVLKEVAKEVEILSIVRIEAGFNWLLDKSIDQTAIDNGPECSIEIILRKK